MQEIENKNNDLGNLADQTEDTVVGKVDPGGQNGALGIVIIVVTFLVVGGLVYAYFSNARPGGGSISTATPRPTLAIPTVAVEPTTPTPDPTAEWRTYTNEKYGYSIRYPANWLYTDKSEILSKYYENALSFQFPIEREFDLGIVGTDLFVIGVVNGNLISDKWDSNQEYFETIRSLQIGVRKSLPSLFSGKEENFIVQKIDDFNSSDFTKVNIRMDGSVNYYIWDKDRSILYEIMNMIPQDSQQYFDSQFVVDSFESIKL